MLRKLNTLKKMNLYFKSNSFLNPTNTLYLEQKYENWLNDPQSVSSSYRVYFENLHTNQTYFTLDDLKGENFVPLDSINIDEQKVYSQIFRLINDFQDYGHYYADIDPTHVDHGKKRQLPKNMNFYNLEICGIKEEILDIELPFDFPYKDEHTKTTRQLHQKLVNTFCGQIAFDYKHITLQENIDWISREIEEVHKPFSKAEKLQIFEYLSETSIFSQYQEIKFQALKRFGIEGLDSSISGLMYMMHQGQNFKIKEVILGMAHRGRLNTLSCVFKKPYSQVFGEFEQTHGRNDPSERIPGFMGDVKYHFGTNHIIEFENGEQMQISLLSNPSHLEVVNPVVLGNAKARQRERKDETGQSVLPIIIHGDAAIGAQGINYETQQMEKLNDYKVGGAIHIVFNNQIGFTTDEQQERTTYFATAVAKLNRNFIITVNADNPELVAKALNMALKYRQKFHRDVYVDIVGYRRYGHNEQDTPDFTQPVLYKKIRQMKSIFELFGEKLVKEGIIDQKYIDEKVEEYMKFFKEEHSKGKDGDYDMLDGDYYDDFEQINNYDGVTGVKTEELLDLGKKINNLPESFHPHKFIQTIFQKRGQEFLNNNKISWHSAEALAFATLLKEGYKIRLSGQDVAFGPFSQRNLMIQDQENSKSKCPLSQVLTEDQLQNLQVVNSPGSQYGCLGFEYGYSYGALKDLTIWEVWLSEYLNNAQQVIDQFIMTAEKKWARYSNLIVSIPYTNHNTRSNNMNLYMDRLLFNLSDDFNFYKNNWNELQNLERRENFIVYNLTTPANYFHVLRSQVKQNFRKPVFLYHNELTVYNSGSTIDQFNVDQGIQKVIDEKYVKPKNAKKIVFCTGKFYFDLRNKRKELGREDVALIRLEQLGPFPYAEVEKVLNNYSKDVEVLFSQEVPLNLGAFPYVEPRLNMILEMKNMKQVKYIGKKVSSVTGSSYCKVTEREFQGIFDKIYD